MTRFRAFGAAALALTATVIALLAARSGSSGLLSPGPPARPHRELSCSSCHGDGAAERAEPRERVASACARCHGAHPSVRPAHAALARSGELGCGTCHAVHRAETGLAFEPDGSVVQYGTGFERSLGPLALAGPLPGSKTSYVPLVAASACTGCHDVERAADPASACFARGASAFSSCFDEHRRPGERSHARPASRDAAVERARELVPELTSERVGAAVSNGSAVALGAVAAGLVLAIARRGRKRRKPGAPAPLVQATPGVRRLPSIDAARCLGCQACVDACPYDVLDMSRYVAVVSRPEQCCGAGPCLLACPNGSLVLEHAAVSSDSSPLGPRFESRDRPGLFFAGDVTGGSLVRSALEQGAAAARSIADELGSRRFELAGRAGSGALDLVVVGAGPAGLGAGLEALGRGLEVLVFEQASIAESIRRFSRDKLVLDTEPSGDDSLPLWIGDAKKEDLLRRWLREVRTRGLAVREDSRVIAVEGRKDAFRVRVARPNGEEQVFAARRVVVATGRRGSPRKLAASVPESALGRVHYELSDARAFAGTRAVVVGLGDVAMETALALALQPGTTVTLVHRGSGFSRGRQKNVEAVGRLVAQGRIGLLFGATIGEIGVERLVVEVEKQTRNISYDALFVHIGAEAPARLPIA